MIHMRFSSAKAIGDDFYKVFFHPSTIRQTQDEFIAVNGACKVFWTMHIGKHMPTTVFTAGRRTLETGPEMFHEEKKGGGPSDLELLLITNEIACL